MFFRQTGWTMAVAFAVLAGCNAKSDSTASSSSARKTATATDENTQRSETLRSSPNSEEKMSQRKATEEQATLDHAKAELAGGNSFPLEFSVTSIGGQQLQLDDYQGQVVVVDLWGTWCPPCRREIPAFIQLQDNYGSRGLQVIGINFENVGANAAEKLVREFIAEQGINYPCALGTDEIQAQIPDFRAFPTTLFIDRTGKVRLKIEGARGYDYLESIVSVLLNEPQPEAS